MRYLCLLLSVLLFNVYSQQSLPNIIFVVADDLGWDDMSYSSTHQIISPNIGKFRSEGRLLEYYYGQAVCAPTRTSLHTGRYPCHTGINTNIVATYSYCPTFDNKYLPLILREYGNYSTHMVGKWHCGFYKWECTPTFRGYESFFGYYTGGEDYYRHTESGYYDFREENGINCGDNCSIVNVEAYGIYSTYLFTDKAQQIITNHNKEKPLFLYLAYQNVHLPNEAPPKYVSQYNTTEENANSRTIHAAQATALDDGFGNVTSLLSDLGYLNDENGNTIIVFTSDNGGLPMNNGGGYNWPLRGGKIDIWEGGTRLNAFVWATKDIMKNKDSLKNGNYTQLMHIVDWWATLIEGAAGININSLNLNYSIDGVNQWSGLMGNDKNDDQYFKYRDNVYYGHNMDPGKAIGNSTSLRYKWYKVLNNTGGAYGGWLYPPPIGDVEYEFETAKDITGDVFFYNISADPFEKENIVNDSSVQSILQQTWDMMVNMEKTCIQLQNDTNCPNISHPVVTYNGRNISVWAPWC